MATLVENAPSHHEQSLPHYQEYQPFKLDRYTMPGVLPRPLVHSKGASIRKIGPTFAAEIIGLDMERGLSDDAFQELQDAVTKVSMVPNFSVQITQSQTSTASSS